MNVPDPVRTEARSLLSNLSDRVHCFCLGPSSSARGPRVPGKRSHSVHSPLSKTRPHLSQRELWNPLSRYGSQAVSTLHLRYLGRHGLPHIW